MGKIELKICMGTMCYVMGGAELKAAIDSLPHEEREQIQISYSPCLGMCNDGGEPPYVQVNGRTIARVSTPPLPYLPRRPQGGLLLNEWDISS